MEKNIFCTLFEYPDHKDITGNAATKKILICLLGAIKENEEGITSDTDIEFLHDFRVAVRRTRSAISQIKYVFPEEKLEKFRQGFRQLSQSSNKLRDLDVYLQKKEEYFTMLPENLRLGLDTFFMDLKKQRDNEFRQFVKVLRSYFFKQLIIDWKTFLISDVKYEDENDGYKIPKNAEKPVIMLAKKFIRIRYKNIIKEAEMIDDDSPDEKLHSLRIQCKKLRYLLEFFTSLFPYDDTKILKKQIKKFQDNLGKFNDLSIQKNMLKEYLDTIDQKSDQAILTAAAIGGLITNLNLSQQHIRSQFSDQFRHFNKNINTKLFEKYFTNSE
ncbi:MAG: CHAD domain-containing protein [Methanosarcinaceae archaeon]